MAPRKAGAMAWEAQRAQLAVAGFREILQTTVTISASGTGSYTVQEANTRRVVAFHVATGATDIRWEMTATADANSMPLLPQRYITIDTEKGEAISFYNETAGSIIVNIMEVE